MFLGRGARFEKTALTDQAARDVAQRVRNEALVSFELGSLAKVLESRKRLGSRIGVGQQERPHGASLPIGKRHRAFEGEGAVEGGAVEPVPGVEPGLDVLAQGPSV